MKTLKELSKEYADRLYSDNLPEDGTNSVLCRGSMKDFEAGYKAAFKWISVEDRLPDTERAILAMNEDAQIGFVWVSNCVQGQIYPYTNPFLNELIEATHWRKINLED